MTRTGFVRAKWSRTTRASVRHVGSWAASLNVLIDLPDEAAKD